MNKIRINILYYFFNFFPLYYLFFSDSIINKIIFVILFLVNGYLLYLEVYKIKNNMKLQKIDNSDFFVYSFYFLSTIILIVGLYSKNLDFIKNGFYLYLSGTIFVNQGIIYYNRKNIILGFLKINREDIIDIKIDNKLLTIKYKNKIERKIKFFSKIKANRFFKFLNNL